MVELPGAEGERTAAKLQEAISKLHRDTYTHRKKKIQSWLQSAAILSAEMSSDRKLHVHHPRLFLYISPQSKTIFLEPRPHMELCIQFGSPQCNGIMEHISLVNIIGLIRRGEAGALGERAGLNQPEEGLG